MFLLLTLRKYIAAGKFLSLRCDHSIFDIWKFNYHFSETQVRRGAASEAYQQNGRQSPLSFSYDEKIQTSPKIATALLKKT